MSVKFTSNFDRFQRDLERKLQSVTGKVSLDALCPPAFMAKYTQFATIDEMFEASGCTVEDVAEPASAAWNQFVAEHSQFDSWEALVAKAGQERIEGAF